MTAAKSSKAKSATKPKSANKEIAKSKAAALRESQDVARTFMLGKLMSAAVARLKAMPDPWALMKKTDQDFHLRALKEECTKAVTECVRLISSDNRTNFLCTLDSVQFKADGVKAQLSMLNEGFAHDLADAAGGSVLIVIEDGKRYLSDEGVPVGEDDQKVLFDGLPPAAPKEQPPKPSDAAPGPTA